MYMYALNHLPISVQQASRSGCQGLSFGVCVCVWEGLYFGAFIIGGDGIWDAKRVKWEQGVTQFSLGKWILTYFKWDLVIKVWQSVSQPVSISNQLGSGAKFELGRAICHPPPPLH